MKKVKNSMHFITASSPPRQDLNLSLSPAVVQLRLWSKGREGSLAKVAVTARVAWAANALPRTACALSPLLRCIMEIATSLCKNLGRVKWGNSGQSGNLVNQVPLTPRFRLFLNEILLCLPHYAVAGGN